MQNKYNLCKTRSKKNDKYLYFIECVKNDIYVYNRTDKERTIDEVFNIFKKIISFKSFCKSDYKIINIHRILPP